jgi:hypothetical protein
MKQSIKINIKPIFLGLLLFLHTDCFGQAFIKGNIMNLKNDSITLYYEENYIALEKKQLNTQLTQNSFNFTVPIEVAGKITIEYIGNDKRKQTIDFFAQPKDSISLSFDANNAINTVNFEGNNFLYNNYWYSCEQKNKNSYLNSVRQRSPEKYLKYIDSLRLKETRFFEELIKKDKKIKPSPTAMSHFYCVQSYHMDGLKMKYPAQKSLLQEVKILPSYYLFLKEHGFQHDGCISNEDYRNFLEIYMMFVYQNKYGVANLQDFATYQKLFDMIPTAFMGKLTKSFLQARIIAKVVLYFPEQAKKLYSKYVEQNPNSIFKKDLEIIVKLS